MALADSLRLARRLGWLDPRQMAATTAAVARWGPTLAAPYASAASRTPRRVAIVDDRGSLSYAELDRQSSDLAHGLRSLGLDDGAHLGILCVNHRGFVETSIAAAKAGLPLVYLNTGFAAPQLAEVLVRERVRVIACDADLVPVVESSGFDGRVIIADGEPGMYESIEHLRRNGKGRSLPPTKPTAPVMLTSGTTGTPKGARRAMRASSASSALGILERIPCRSGDVSVLPTPLFHAWGLVQLAIAAATGSTAVLVRRFSPEATLAAIEAERGTVLAVVPIMMQRILDSDCLGDYDTSSLRIVASSGSALPGPVALAWMDQFGDTLYNMYGSTEVGQATLAGPEDLRAAPGTAGRVAPGSRVEIVDQQGRPVSAGGEGRIVVGNSAQFSEYTGGGTKERVGGLMESGDVGYFDSQGRLFVTGRADDMIVSGGENVFPQEIEEVLLHHADITDAAVVGVPDPEFGQRLAAFVVRSEGAEIDERGVRSYVASQLARHKVPRDVTFLDELPRNTTGKLLRQALTN